MVQNFRENAKNHMNANFRDKNFVIATFFRDYLLAAAPTLTIHVVAPPTILTRGVGARKRNSRNNVSNSSLASEAFNPPGRPS